MLVSASCAISCMKRSQKFFVARHTQNPGWTVIAQGRVLSPLLFNLLINSLIASVRQVAPGVQFWSSSLRVPGQLCADDLELSAECEFDLQVALDAVGRWGSAMALLVWHRANQVCSGGVWPSEPFATCDGVSFLGVILTPTLSWTAHARHLVTRGNRLFAQCVVWCKTEWLSFRFASTLFTSYVLPSISWGYEFFFSSPPALRVIDSAQRGQIPSGMALWLPCGSGSLGTWLA